MLTFVNPAFLVGLLAAGVPVAIHLLRGEKRPRTVFPPAMLLVSAAEVRRRGRNLAEIVLLILRVLVVVGLMLALARPKLP
ncbi:MAG: BatA domain-containing protein, partial [Planctomycetota bacterium]